jgi:hypothetical protein
MKLVGTSESMNAVKKNPKRVNADRAPNQKSASLYQGWRTGYDFSPVMLVL